MGMGGREGDVKLVGVVVGGMGSGPVIKYAVQEVGWYIEWVVV